MTEYKKYQVQELMQEILMRDFNLSGLCLVSSEDDFTLNLERKNGLYKVWVEDLVMDMEYICVYHKLSKCIDILSRERKNTAITVEKTMYFPIDEYNKPKRKGYVRITEFK